MPNLTDAELRMVAEVVTELSKLHGTAFDKAATGFNLARAALIDPKYKAKLIGVYRRLDARRTTKLPRKTLAPLAPLFRDLERDAEAVLSGWKHS